MQYTYLIGIQSLRYPNCEIHGIIFSSFIMRSTNPNYSLTNVKEIEPNAYSIKLLE